MPISSGLIALTIPDRAHKFNSECVWEPWVGLDDPAVIRLNERLGDKPRLECALPDSKIAKSGIAGVSHVALWRLIREDKFVAVTIGRARTSGLADLPAWTVPTMQGRQGLLQADVLGPLAHELATVFKQVRPRTSLLNRTAYPMPQAQLGDFAELAPLPIATQHLLGRFQVPGHAGISHGLWVWAGSATESGAVLLLLREALLCGAGPGAGQGGPSPAQNGLFPTSALCRDAMSQRPSRPFSSCQIVPVSKRVRLRVSALNSTPTKWTGSPFSRYWPA